MIILLVFICSYYVSNSGYYEYHMQERTILTNEKIKEFERDVEKNKDIDISEINKLRLFVYEQLPHLDFTFFTLIFCGFILKYFS